jgi:hypothetical protein
LISTADQPRDGAAQWGFSLVEILAVMCLLTVAICTAALVAAKGVLQARHAGLHADARTAASALVNAEPPEGLGGSVAPDAPVAGWFDIVVVSAATGRLERLEGTARASDVPIRRQWRVAVERGVRVYTVSAELLGSDASTPLAPAQGGGRFLFNRTIR